MDAYMGGWTSKGEGDDIGPATTKRGREEAILWARAIVAKGIRVVRLRSSKPAAPPRAEPIVLTSDPQS